jgi:hypothetical protein
MDGDVVVGPCIIRYRKLALALVRDIRHVSLLHICMNKVVEIGYYKRHGGHLSMVRDIMVVFYIQYR